MAGAALAATPPVWAQVTPKVRVIATGLQFPEGPVALADGAVLVCEIQRRTLTRVAVNGMTEVLAELGGGPNGAAIGPDGACYVCNNGGLSFPSDGAPVPPRGGSIQRVDLATGKFSTLIDSVNGFPLVRPNDLVFDRDGGFWFTDAGRTNARTKDLAGVYWARADGNGVREVVYGLDHANGVALAPDGRTLYVGQVRLASYRVIAPGALEHETSWMLFGRKVEGSRPRATILAAADDGGGFDSMKVEADGRIVIGTIGTGGLTVLSADGRERSFVALPDPMTTNLAFGGPDMKTAYVCFSSRGELAAIEWPRPGLKLRHAA